MKNKGLLVLALLLLIAWRKKGKTSVIVDYPTNSHSSDADYLVEIKPGAKYWSANKTHIMGTATNTQQLDGFNTGELPLWLKVRLGNVFYYVQSGDFKILN